MKREAQKQEQMFSSVLLTYDWWMCVLRPCSPKFWPTHNGIMQKGILFSGPPPKYNVDWQFSFCTYANS